MVTTRPLSRSLCRPLSRALVWLTDQLFATLLVDPTGADNSVLYTAKQAGAGGEDISVAYAAVATSAETTVAVVADAITVTPGSTARMVIGGLDLTSDGTTPVIFPALKYLNISSGKPRYTAVVNGIEYYVEWVSGPNLWALAALDLITNPAWFSYDNVATPDLVTTWVTGATNTGTPTVTAGISSAAQVIAAVNAYPAAAALVTASESGAATGPVAQVAAANLILANALTLDGVALTLDGATLTLD